MHILLTTRACSRTEGAEPPQSTYAAICLCPALTRHNPAPPLASKTHEFLANQEFACTNPPNSILCSSFLMWVAKRSRQRPAPNLTGELPDQGHCMAASSHIRRDEYEIETGHWHERDRENKRTWLVESISPCPLKQEAWVIRCGCLGSILPFSPWKWFGCSTTGYLRSRGCFYKISTTCPFVLTQPKTCDFAQSAVTREDKSKNCIHVTTKHYKSCTKCDQENREN